MNQTEIKKVVQTVKIPLKRPWWGEEIEQQIKIALAGDQSEKDIKDAWKSWKSQHPNDPWNGTEWKSCLSICMRKCRDHYNYRCADFVKQMSSGGRSSILQSFGYSTPEGWSNLLPVAVRQGLGDKLKSNTAGVWQDSKKAPYSRADFIKINRPVDRPYHFECIDGRYVVKDLEIASFGRDKNKPTLQVIPSPNAGKKKVNIQKPFLLDLRSRIKNSKQWNNSVERRLVTGELQSNCCEIVKDSKNRYFISFVVQMEIQESDSDKVAGMDLGLKQPVVLSGEGKERFTIRGNEYLHMRRQRYRREGDIKHQNRFNRTGHGVKNKFKPLISRTERYQRRDKKWIERVAAQAVAWLKHHKYGTLVAEDLSSNIGERRHIRYPYKRLLDQVAWCCKKVGIKFAVVNPAYTSRRCSKCGFIENDFSFEHRVNKKMPGFACSICGFGTNKYVDADWNAACNIRTPDIGLLIQKQLKKQKIGVEILEEYVEVQELNLDELDVVDVVKV